MTDKLEVVTSDSIPSNNRTGYEVIVVILPAIFYTFITVILETYCQLGKPFCFVLEICTIVLPLILGMTTLADNTGVLLSTVVMISGLFLLLFSLNKKSKQSKSKILDTKFITNLRSGTNLISVIAILAVDFTSFPSRFEKLDTFGYSLMDTGVGLYVFANGIVSPESRGVQNPISHSLKSSLPLLVIGSARFILTKLFNYHVPVSEYGVHWNFFITLATTKLFTSFFLNIFKVKDIYINAIMILLAHQMLLVSGLQKFVFDDFPRENFVTQNKEGLISSIGFVALYLFSVYFGHVLKLNQKNQSILKMFITLTLSIVLSLTFSILFQQMFGISRRTANAAYICWILFIGTLMTGLFYCLQIILSLIFGPKAVSVPYIFEAINYNGLVFFLVSNVVTGLINMSIITKEVNDFYSLLIIFCYVFANCLLVCSLLSKGIKIKL